MKARICIFFLQFFLSVPCSAWTWNYRTTEPKRDGDSLRFTRISTETHKVGPFTQLIPSWNARRPKQGYFRFFARVRDAATGKWLRWHPLYEWGYGVQKSFNSKASDGSEFIHVRLELPSGIYADGFDMRVEAFDGASLDDMVLLSATVSDLTKFSGEYVHHQKKLPSVHVPGVIQHSQMVLDHPSADSICSPTSTTMLTHFVTKKDIDPVLFAEGAYDFGLGVYGSWPFNMAHAYEHGDETHHFVVQRLPSFKELHASLMRGYPVVVSVRGAIRGAPKEYPKGHLLVVVGFDAAKKLVICHDPAAPSSREVLKKYDLRHFLAAWSRSHNLAYRAVPIERDSISVA